MADIAEATQGAPGDGYDLLLYVLGRSIAHDMLLRILFAMWCEQQPNPQGFAFEVLEGMVGSLGVTDESGTSPEINEAAERHLRDFFENVSTRLASRGHPKPG